MKVKEDLHIVGPYPPPYGGVSVHIARMLPFLKSSKISYILYDQYSTNLDSKKIIATNKSMAWWLGYLFRSKPKVIHIHQFSFFIFIYAFILSLSSKSKVIVSVHNENILNKGNLYKFFATFFVKVSRRCDYIIVSEKVFSALQSKHCINIRYLPAYVPPSNVEHKKLPSENAKPIVLFNAWKLNNSLSKVYGFDLLAKLAVHFRDYNFYCFVGDEVSAKFVDDYVSENKISNINSIACENLIDYLSCADLFLRLNREDAYGVSVKEALDLGVSVIASDVCTRAKGARLFSSGSVQSLIHTINELELINFRLDKSQIDKTDFHIQLIDIYKKYLGA